jgi:hypothetical protein
MQRLPNPEPRHQVGPESKPEDIKYFDKWKLLVVGLCLQFSCAQASEDVAKMRLFPGNDVCANPPFFAKVILSYVLLVFMYELLCFIGHRVRLKDSVRCIKIIHMCSIVLHYSR